MSASDPSTSANRRFRVPIWMAGAVLLVVGAACMLRFGTAILDKDAVFDERFIRAPIVDLIERGWSVETAIDFTETKGPGMIWPYALMNRLLGPELNALRLTTMLMFIAGVFPLLLMAQQCGLHGWRLLLIAVGYILLPYYAVLGQLLMSEASFVFAAMCLMLIFTSAMNESGEGRRPAITGLVVFGIVLSILLHHRIHAAAIAAAVCLVAFNRDGLRSWPWWLTCLLAGLSRIPLWLRWGGLVAPEFQGPHGLGLSLQNLSYLGATLVPYIGVCFVAVIVMRPRWWWFSLVGAGVGMLLGVVATPDLMRTLPLLDGEVLRYQGIVATFIGRTAGDGPLAAVMLVLLTAVGVGGLGGLAALAFDKAVESAEGLIWRVQFWALAAGWGMYLLTDSVVYDRYPLAWAIVLPLIWVRDLPRWLLLLQLGGLAIIMASLTHTWLL